ncbi:hypothetical protein F4803DRAFT_548544 [Xylaria telfairii]|nr:hypothetical protein F4803DRAFT_548544 [Xylaria telfairii]
MLDYAVHFTFINKTSERLEQDPDGTDAMLGYWVNLPQTIQPHGQAVFQIADDFGFSGSEATNTFFVKTNLHDSKRSRIHMSGGGDWQDNSVPASGHPLYVEYTVDHQSKPYRFTLTQLAATTLTRPPIAGSGHIDVTIRALDLELINAEVIVLGSVGEKRVFQTDYFFSKSLADRVVTAHVVDPASSRNPFAKNTDVEWS